MIKVNGKMVEFEKFPNKETKMNHHTIDITNHNIVSFKYEDDSDLIKLMFVKKYLDTCNADARLNILYMPYSRMDRSESNSPFTLKYVASFINNLDFSSIRIIEPHSDVTNDLVFESKPIYINFELIKEVMKEVVFNIEEDYIMFPDKGAKERYANMSETSNILVGEKVRDFETGRITSLEVNSANGEPTITNKVIIVDDLSSYGGTFCLSAQQLRELGFKEIYLLVAHAEDSIFYGKLFNSIDKLFTTDSILSEEEIEKNQYLKNQLKVFKLEDY